MISYLPFLILENSKHIIEFANCYCETSPYLTIYGKDEKRGSHGSVCHGWTCMFHGNVVRYYKKDVPTHIQESLKGLSDSIQRQRWTNVKLHFGKNINDFFES